MGSITANPPDPPFTITSGVGELPHLSLLHSRFDILLPGGKDIRLNFIKRDYKVFNNTDEAADQLTKFKDKYGKDLTNAILISYNAYVVDNPNPRSVTKINDLYWDGAPVQVIIEVNDVGGTSSTVTDIAD